MADDESERGHVRVTNTGKATTAGALGGAISAWLAFKAQSKFDIPTEIAAEVISLVSGTIGGIVARWAAKLNPHE